MIAIRGAKQKDRESIWRIHIRAIKEICKSHYSENELKAWSEVLKPSRYKGSIDRKELFVAEDSNFIIGFGQIDQENGIIEAVYVSPDYNRRGIGRKILQSLESVAQDSKLRKLRLRATLNSVPFYTKTGYTTTNQSGHLLPFDMVPCVYMVKDLNVIRDVCAESA